MQKAQEIPTYFEEKALPDCPFTMLRIPAGEFMMGDEVGDLKFDWSTNGPLHKRSTEHDFFLAQTQVTQALWQAVLTHPDLKIQHKLKLNPSAYQGANRPVEQISWEDIQVWLKCLNQITSLNYRLPTEAEWEYAARSPLKEKALKKLERYAGTDQMHETGWFEENENQSTRTARLKTPNAFGLYDMSGNVWEWCQDHYKKEYDPKNIDFSAFDGGEKGDRRVLRGGSFFYAGLYCRVAYRSYAHPDYGWLGHGFRLALSLSEEWEQSGILASKREK
jgi:formylglycine-generating enzyme